MDVGEVQAGGRLVQDVWPVEFLPNSLASLARWASPSESWVLGWPSLTQLRPTSFSALSMRWMAGKFSKKAIASSTVIFGDVLAAVVDVQRLGVVPRGRGSDPAGALQTVPEPFASPAPAAPAVSPLGQQYQVMGIGGAGGMFTPAVSPNDPDLMFISCDIPPANPCIPAPELEVVEELVHRGHPDAPELLRRAHVLPHSSNDRPHG